MGVLSMSLPVFKPLEHGFFAAATLEAGVTLVILGDAEPDMLDVLADLVPDGVPVDVLNLDEPDVSDEDVFRFFSHGASMAAAKRVAAMYTTRQQTYLTHPVLADADVIVISPRHCGGDASAGDAAIRVASRSTPTSVKWYRFTKSVRHRDALETPSPKDEPKTQGWISWMLSVLNCACLE